MPLISGILTAYKAKRFVKNNKKPLCYCKSGCKACVNEMLMYYWSFCSPCLRSSLLIDFLRRGRADSPKPILPKL